MAKRDEIFSASPISEIQVFRLILMVSTKMISGLYQKNLSVKIHKMVKISLLPLFLQFSGSFCLERVS